VEEASIQPVMRPQACSREPTTVIKSFAANMRSDRGQRRCARATAGVHAAVHAQLALVVPQSAAVRGRIPALKKHSEAFCPLAKLSPYVNRRSSTLAVSLELWENRLRPLLPPHSSLLPSLLPATSFLCLASMLDD
jgi:hypothetical protein